MLAFLGILKTLNLDDLVVAEGHFCPASIKDFLPLAMNRTELTDNEWNRINRHTYTRDAVDDYWHAKSSVLLIARRGSLFSSVIWRRGIYERPDTRSAPARHRFGISSHTANKRSIGPRSMTRHFFSATATVEREA